MAPRTAPKPQNGTTWQQESAKVTHSRPLQAADGDLERESVPLTSAGPRPDPWGVERAENLIASLTGVLSVRVVVTPLGEVIVNHALTTSIYTDHEVTENE